MPICFQGIIVWNNVAKIWIALFAHLKKILKNYVIERQKMQYACVSTLVTNNYICIMTEKMKMIWDISCTVLLFCNVDCLFHKNWKLYIL